MKEDSVILVNEQDEEIGFMPKLQAHRMGVLHRAFSLILFNSTGRMLIQKRSVMKYHSASLWSNACCSHPRPGENICHAVVRRCKEELGIQIKNPVFKGKFIYHTSFPNGLSEHELDYVFEAHSNQLPLPDPSEIEEIKYISPEELKKNISYNPYGYTYWFREIISLFYL